ncbi:LutC/YkgG family protein [Flaviaesturariibacter flavus]|uniref:LutC/YkgG family protein n=1 Tax=Flaviaesturariibacter flavus TaxID=2502780 RepID=UPI001FB5345B|nr:lactate utilization protein [Flaviaesturariibacter flavus]
MTHSTPIPFPKSEGNDPVVQPRPDDDIVVTFAEEFTKLQGKFAFCLNETELYVQLEALRKKQEWTRIYTSEQKWRGLVPEQFWTDDIVTCDASITDCEALVARTGTIVLSARNGGRIPSVYAPVHVCVAYASQLVYDLGDAIALLQKRYEGRLPSQISFATGPSRTADIEKTLVTGVHGPKEVYLFLVDDLGASS